jgi:hypothetical protein
MVPTGCYSKWVVFIYSFNYHLETNSGQVFLIQSAWEEKSFVFGILEYLNNMMRYIGMRTKSKHKIHLDFIYTLYSQFKGYFIYF